MPQEIAENIFKYVTAGGLTVLLEPLDHVVSTALVFATPVGSARDGVDHAGAAGVISEWIFRGAAGGAGRDIASRLDFLGCHRDETVRAESLYLSSTQADRALDDTLAVYADLMTRANFADETFEPCVELARQELEGLEDQPSRKCSQILRETFFPAPLGASPYGTAEGLAALTPEFCRRHARSLMTPAASLLAVAGHFQVDALCERIETLTAHWTGPAAEALTVTPSDPQVLQIAKPSAQVQIGLAWGAPLVTEADYYPCRIAEMVLSGGMSGRLFTEVREKRGLVYSVSASYRANARSAGMFVYAGTAPERAQQTLDVTVEQLKKLADGITDEELQRARTQLKTSLIMQGERTGSRASGLVNDWMKLGAARTLEMISEAIDAVTLEQVNAYLAARPAGGFTAVLLGPEPLDTTVLA